MRISTLSLLMASCVLAGPALAQHAAHEHGHGDLKIAIDGDELQIELTSPGADIVGFEHAPKTDADHAAVDAAVEKLKGAAALFPLPGAAGCESEGIEIYSALIDGGSVKVGDHDHDDHGHKDDDHAHKDDDHGHKDDDHAHKDDDHGHKDDDHAHKDDDHGHKDDDHAHGDRDLGPDHAEFRVHYHFECKDITAVTAIETTYFKTFPAAEELDAAALTPNGQAAAELTPDSTRIEF
ncbi:MAG: DUF2796 domain-containing protein [Pseudomonadota bacterium]